MRRGDDEISSSSTVTTRSMDTHAIDPRPASCLGILCRVDAHCIELTAEDLVRETQVVADALVEAVVAHCNVEVAPAELPCVDAGV